MAGMSFTYSGKFWSSWHRSSWGSWRML